MKQTFPKDLCPDDFDAEEATEKLCVLKHLINTYQAGAQRTGVHSFIEYTELMNEHLNLLHFALRNRIDPDHSNVHGSQSVRMPGFTARYIGEKFACIFAPFFTSETWQEFCDEVSKNITHPKS